MKLALLTSVGLLCFAPAFATQTTVADIEYGAYTPQTTVIQPGAFSLDESSNSITPLCVPSGTQWLLPGDPPFTVCADAPGTNAPPVSQQYQLTPSPPTGESWVVANLGINNTQWTRSHQIENDGSVSNTDVLKMVGQSAHLHTNGYSVEWSLDSSKLPPGLTAEIPGSGQYMHMQDELPGTPVVYPFAGASDYLTFSTSAGFPSYQLTGSSTTIATIGISLQAPDASGNLQPISLLVSLFNSKGLYSEYVSTDGRNNYAATALSVNPTFITPITTSEIVPGAANKVFTFEMTVSNMTALFNALNSYLAAHNMPTLPTDVTKVRLHQVDIRNENSFLDKGTVDISFDVGYVRVVNTTP